MASPARQHRDRVLAAQAANAALPGVAAPPPTSGPAATAYEQMLMQLLEDRQRLKDIQSIEKKIELKRELLPNYRAWIEGVLKQAAETGQAVQDEVVVNILPWLIDVGDYADAIALAAHVLRFRLVLPERFKRTPATLVTEEIAGAILATLNADLGAVTIETAHMLFDLESVVAGHDMPDEVAAKLQKAIGLTLAAAADAATPDDHNVIAGFVPATRTEALARLRRAIALDPRAGVKKNIEALERALKREAATTEPSSNTVPIGAAEKTT
jgi:hypothetical protein